ncbi:hypothetical protein CIT292_09143 [Citrobacter youngae ATCC 29220]|uniref:Uncharacterized protein n=1 Tax=Citrobacter youngae ATCC 29220 TaxID=500640 RepID=D4BFX3_9ENTR|nr:hypothetical protein CIT292_09143 [Citrobacter youngae ATCC 29220]
MPDGATLIRPTGTVNVRRSDKRSASDATDDKGRSMLRPCCIR